MKKNLSRIYKILSVLLGYPGEDYLSQIKEIEVIAADMPPDEFKNSINEFIAYIRTRSMIRLREIYTDAFDVSPATTMNLTYHIWGDNEKRAGMLTRLQQVYQDAGYERISGELPDYLPMLLEFLSACPEDTDVKLIWECFQHFDTYIDRLKQMSPAHAALLQPLADTAVKYIQSKEFSPRQHAAELPGKLNRPYQEL
ncbi:MAG: nitrate reductase molybdenum cofactor assembly chaperone [Deltaproteobacteria bacterium]|nr:nitrate reductase molybdenum cofactor assembly chaperone [Deltaproteobacteria bacterium]